MKISIPITQDDFNSDPTGEVEMRLFDDSVSIKISDSTRVVSVRKEDIRKLLLVLLD